MPAKKKTKKDKPIRKSKERQILEQFILMAYPNSDVATLSAEKFKYEIRHRLRSMAHSVKHYNEMHKNEQKSSHERYKLEDSVRRQLGYILGLTGRSPEVPRCASIDSLLQAVTLQLRMKLQTIQALERHSVSR